MNDEIEKQQYRELRIKLKDIRREIEDLKNLHNEFVNIMQKNLLINNRIIDDDLFEKLKRNNNIILQELTNTVLPSINNKC